MAYSTNAHSKEPSSGTVFSLVLIFNFLFLGGIIFANQTWLHTAEPGSEPAPTAIAALSTDLPTAVPSTVEPTVDPPTTVPSTVPTATSLAQVAAISPEVGSNGPHSFAYDQTKAEEGRRLFITCSACHGLDAHGLPNLGKNLVESEFVHSLTDQDFLNFVKTGRPIWDPLNTTGVDMPARGGNPTLTDDQILEIIAYIRSISP